MLTDDTPENKVDIVIYVNGTIKDDTPLGWLIHDLSCKDVSKMHYPALAKRARYLKETEKGMREMTGTLMKLIEEVGLPQSVAEMNRFANSQRKE